MDRTERLRAIKERHKKINENKFLWQKHYNGCKKRRIKKEIDADFIDMCCGEKQDDDRRVESKIRQCKEDYYKEAN